jgi:hypothetical protein
LENLKLFSNKIWISEESDPDVLFVKVLICDFSVNLNKVQLNRNTIDTWISTLKDAPLVGKIKAKSNGEIDFTSHNATIVTRVDEQGHEYQDIEFNSDAFGTFTGVEIEEVDGVESIVANCKVWKRFFDASQLIQKRIKAGTLSTSWEIAVEDSEKKIVSGELIKVINKGRFIGHALLSATTPPAYPRSKVLEVASSENDEELCSAILQDILALNNENPQGNEVQTMPNENEVVIENAEEKPADPPVVEQAEETPPVVEQPAEPTYENPTVAELTMWDIRKKVEQAICNKLDVCWLDMIWLFPANFKAWAHKYEDDEMNLNEFTYEVVENEVVVSEPTPVTLTVSPREANSALSARDETIVSLNSKIQTLESEVATLSPYKAAAEQAERERLEEEKKQQVAELRKYVEDANVFTKEELEGEELSTLISELKTVEVKAKIADRIVEKQVKTRKPETASVEKPQPKPKADINTEITEKPVEALRNWLHK